MLFPCSLGCIDSHFGSYNICRYISIFTCEIFFVGMRHMLTHYPSFSSLLLTYQARAFHSPPNKSSNYFILKYVRFWHTDIGITGKHNYIQFFFFELSINTYSFLVFLVLHKFIKYYLFDFPYNLNLWPYEFHRAGRNV